MLQAASSGAAELGTTVLLLAVLHTATKQRSLLARFQKNPFLLECLAGTDGHVCVCVLRMRLNSHVRACMCVCFC